MPYKSEKIKIANTKYDRRCKLSEDKIKAIKLLKDCGYSYRKLAAMFGCSKWSVQSIINPVVRKPEPKRPAEYWAQKKREYRARKQQLFISGAIKPTKTTKKK